MSAFLLLPKYERAIERILALEAERELTINTLELMGKGLAYENVTKAKTQSAGHELMRIARSLRECGSKGGA